MVNPNIVAERIKRAEHIAGLPIEVRDPIRRDFARMMKQATRGKPAIFLKGEPLTEEMITASLEQIADRAAKRAHKRVATSSMKVIGNADATSVAKRLASRELLNSIKHFSPGKEEIEAIQRIINYRQQFIPGTHIPIRSPPEKIIVQLMLTSGPTRTNSLLSAVLDKSNEINQRAKIANIGKDLENDAFVNIAQRMHAETPIQMTTSWKEAEKLFGNNVVDKTMQILTQLKKSTTLEPQLKEKLISLLRARNAEDINLYEQVLRKTQER